MREPVTSDKLKSSWKRSPRPRDPDSRYLVGGATRSAGLAFVTIDVDLKFIPETDEYSELPSLKERLHLNIALLHRRISFRVPMGARSRLFTEER